MYITIRVIVVKRFIQVLETTSSMNAIYPQYEAVKEPFEGTAGTFTS